MPSPVGAGLLSVVSVGGGVFLELFSGAGGLVDAMWHHGAACSADIVQTRHEDRTDIIFLELLCIWSSGVLARS